MKVFAIELSSRQGSVALIDNGEVVAEHCWEEDFRNRRKLFDALHEMEIDWDCIDIFGVGRGPGAFSGMRISFSVANALAAPLGKPVLALNSAAAIAAQSGARLVSVVGDARRNRVWVGVFRDQCLVRGFELIEPSALGEFIPQDSVVASPDYSRLRELLAPYAAPQGGAEQFPQAGVLGRLIAQRVAEKAAPEPAEPLYMHPPVFIAPRFPA
jgi:tRNA threonylcarbamoyl adenosine modification protein YeaZ